MEENLTSQSPKLDSTQEFVKMVNEIPINTYWKSNDGKELYWVRSYDVQRDGNYYSKATRLGYNHNETFFIQKDSQFSKFDKDNSKEITKQEFEATEKRIITLLGSCYNELVLKQRLFPKEAEKPMSFTDVVKCIDYNLKDVQKLYFLYYPTKNVTRLVEVNADDIAEIDGTKEEDSKRVRTSHMRQLTLDVDPNTATSPERLNKIFILVNEGYTPSEVREMAGEDMYQLNQWEFDEINRVFDKMIEISVDLNLSDLGDLPF